MRLCAAALILVNAEPSLAGGSSDEAVANFWTSADLNPPGFADSLAKFRALIVATQHPAPCQRLCRSQKAIGGGAGSVLHRLAYLLLEAVLTDCALVEKWAPLERYATSDTMKQRCVTAGRAGLECYFQPISNCGAEARSGLSTVTYLSAAGREHHVHALFRNVSLVTGLKSQALIMGTLLSWIMRPQPELAAAVKLYGQQLGIGGGAEHSSRHRLLALHIRHGDKSSTYDP